MKITMITPSAKSCVTFGKSRIPQHGKNRPYLKTSHPIGHVENVDCVYCKGLCFRMSCTRIRESTYVTISFVLNVSRTVNSFVGNEWKNI